MHRAEIFVFCVTLAGVSSQVINFGDCPALPVVQNFDLAGYLGKWYEIERYPLIFELFGKCVTAEYTDNGNGIVGVHNEQINSLTNTKQTITGTANLDGENGEAKLAVNFPGFLGSIRGSYWVIGTDYKNYSVVWSCLSLGHIHLTSSWILARVQNPSAEILEQANKVIEENNIKRSDYSRTDQDNCPKNNTN